MEVDFTIDVHPLYSCLIQHSVKDSLAVSRKNQFVHLWPQQMTHSNEIYSNSKCKRYLNSSILFFFLNIVWWKLQCMHLITKTVVMIHVFETIKYLIVLCKQLCTVTNKPSLVFDNYNISVPLHAIPSWQAFISLAIYMYMYGTIKWSLWHS